MIARSVFVAGVRILVVLAVGACGSAGSVVTSDPGAQPGTPAQAGTASPILLPPGSPGETPFPGAHAEGPPYPIVLMHGMGGFDELQEGPIDITYFNGVVADLAAHGEPLVFTTTAPPYDTSEDRAQVVAVQIAAILAQTGKAKVNLVGHSQGGMDARVLASPNGLAMGDVIASVTTIATPHQGTLVADAALGLLQGFPPALIDDVTTAFLDLLQQTIYDEQTDPQLMAQLNELSQAYMTTTFNPKYVDDPKVVYASYGGRTNLESGLPDCASAVYADDPTKLDAAQPELTTTAQFLQGTDGTVNDGLVTIASARWGTFLQCVPADHLAEVGQIEQNGPDPLSGFDHLVFFRDVVGRIRAQGF
jgi:triacylglycerol lipase